MKMTKKKTERQPLEFYLAQKYPVTLYPDSEGYVVEIKDLPGCITQADTVEEAFAEIEDARVLWIESAYEHDDPIPPPSTEVQYSGKTLLRMPRSLHQRLAEAADQEGVSLNQYLVSQLSEATSAKTSERALSQMQGKIDAIYSSVLRQAESTHTAIT
jgi:antitoxin HicB